MGVRVIGAKAVGTRAMGVKVVGAKAMRAVYSALLSLRNNIGCGHMLWPSQSSLLPLSS